MGRFRRSLGLKRRNARDRGDLVGTTGFFNIPTFEHKMLQRVKSSQELLPDTHKAERSKKKHGRGLPTGRAGCVSECGAPAAGRLRGLSVRARALRDTYKRTVF